jgi:hypothetical protein
LLQSAVVVQTGAPPPGQFPAALSIWHVAPPPKPAQQVVPLAQPACEVHIGAGGGRQVIKPPPPPAMQVAPASAPGQSAADPQTCADPAGHMAMQEIVAPPPIMLGTRQQTSPPLQLEEPVHAVDVAPIGQAIAFAAHVGVIPPPVQHTCGNVHVPVPQTISVGGRGFVPPLLPPELPPEPLPPLPLDELWTPLDPPPLEPLLVPPSPLSPLVEPPQAAATATAKPTEVRNSMRTHFMKATFPLRQRATYPTSGLDACLRLSAVAIVNRPYGLFPGYADNSSAGRLARTYTGASFALIESLSAMPPEGR